MASSPNIVQGSTVDTKVKKREVERQSKGLTGSQLTRIAMFFFHYETIGKRLSLALVSRVSIFALYRKSFSALVMGRCPKEIHLPSVL